MGKDPHERALKKYFSRHAFGELNYNQMIQEYGEHIEALEYAHKQKRERQREYTDLEKKYLHENPLWHEKKFIGSKEFCCTARGLSPPLVDLNV